MFESLDDICRKNVGLLRMLSKYAKRQITLFIMLSLGFMRVFVVCYLCNLSFPINPMSVHTILKITIYITYVIIYTILYINYLIDYLDYIDYSTTNIDSKCILSIFWE